MIQVVEQTIKYFVAHGKAPEIASLEIKDSSLKEKQGGIFVTIYEKWEVRGSAGNIKPIESTLLEELVWSTVSALSADDRFEPVNLQESEALKIRIDEVLSEIILVHEKELLNLEPKKFWVIAIKKDYEKIAVILPNISSTLHFGKDFPEALGNKLWEKFTFKDYIVYKLETRQTTNF